MNTETEVKRHAASPPGADERGETEQRDRRPVGDEAPNQHAPVPRASVDPLRATDRYRLVHGGALRF